MKRILFFGIVSLLLLSVTNVSGQARYNIKYDFYEWGPFFNQGPVEVLFFFDGHSSNANYYWNDLYEMGNSRTTSFLASANTDLFYLHFGWGGDGLQIFNYTPDIGNIYKTTSYWNKRYPLRPYTGANQYQYWTAHYLDWFDVTIWPKNLSIQRVEGPTAGSNTNVLAQNDLTTLVSMPGFPTDAYTWRYQITGVVDSWVNFPNQFQGKSSISFTGDQLLKDNNNPQLFEYCVNSGLKINVAVFHKNELGNLTNNGLFKTLIPKFNAPKIVSVTAQPAKCNDSPTTSVIIKLDKPVGVGNTISFLYLQDIQNPLNSGTSVDVAHASFNAQNECEITGIPVGNAYKISLVDYTDGSITLQSKYYISPTPFPFVTTTVPPPLQAQLSKTGIFCNGGTDGFINAQVTGGTTSYTLNYKNSSGNSIALHNYANSDVSQWASDALAVTNLSPGFYSVEVSDINACLTTSSITITQPLNSLAITARTLTEVSGYGLSNGAFELKLTGGTSVLPQGYPVPSLQHSNNTVYTATFVSEVNNEYTYRFSNLPAGDYHFRSEDAALTPNKVNIRDSAGCMVKEITTIIQPAPLVIDFEKSNVITCYAGEDGAVIAHVTGGKRFATAMPYSYVWSYSVDGIATYRSITNTDSVLTTIKAGFYKLKVTDKNNNITTSVYEMTQPLRVDFDATVKNVTCLNWTDGAISIANLRGGAAPYEVLWYNGSNDYEVHDLGHGYFNVRVSDALSCVTSKNIQVKDTLNGITLSQGTYVMPYCYGNANGALGVTIEVDRPPYTVLWNTGSTNELLTAIPAGEYTVQVLNSNNCLKEKTFVLENPNPIPLDIDASRYLCIGQTADYDIEVPDSVYQYYWEGPSLSTNETSVSLAGEGIYKATITDSKGCIAEKEVELFRVNKTIACEFVVPTQVYAGDEVSLVNITQLTQADGAEWNFYNNDNISIVEEKVDYATVVFEKEGLYTVGLTTHQDECTKVLKKQITVLTPNFDHKIYNGATSFIKEFEIRPNPNDGRFEVMIRLQEAAAVRLRFMNFYSNDDIVVQDAADQKDYVIPMQVSVPPGTYILLLETPYGSRITKVVIM